MTIHWGRVWPVVLALAVIVAAWAWLVWVTS
jgi:hypothetical protein